MIEQLRNWLREANLEVACLTNPISIAYLIGLKIEPHERLMALVIRDDRASLLLPEFERKRAQAGASGIEEFKGWNDGEDPWQELASLIGERTRLAVEKDYLTLDKYEKLSSRLPLLARGRELSDVSDQLKRMRQMKAPQELEYLAQAAQLTDQLYEQLLPSIRAGISELELSLRLSELMGKLGTQPAFEHLIQFGPHAAEPHGVSDTRKLIPGQLVLLDFGATYRGYHADTTRVAVLGEPDQKQLEIHKIVLEAHDRAIEAVRAGVTAGEVDAAARSVISEAGYGDFFTHRTGHGLGLEIHEAPNLTPGSDIVLEAGMVCTVEPGIYIPDWGGIRIEDDIVVEEQGARLLTSSPRDLKSLVS